MAQGGRSLPLAPEGVGAAEDRPRAWEALGSLAEPLCHRLAPCELLALLYPCQKNTELEVPYVEFLWVSFFKKTVSLKLFKAVNPCEWKEETFNFFI